jgi:hypothetical protein
MADDYNISYNFQIGTAPPETHATGHRELIAFANCDLMPVGGSGTLLLNRDNGKQLLVSPEVANTLTYCNTFRTLSDHASHLVERFPQLRGQLDDVSKVLGTMNESGLMLKASEVLARLGPNQAHDLELAPTRICILTCDRPAAVERLLDSMLRIGSLARHGELFLIDDSREQANGEQNRELVARFNLTSARTMHYLGASELLAFLEALIAECPSYEAEIRFLLDRSRWAGERSYGLARNVSLLLSAGYRCIMLDDDILCTAIEPPFRREGIGFGDGDSRELACFSSVDELMRNAQYSPTDPLSGHASCLGMSLSQMLRSMDLDPLREAALKNTNAAFLNTLHADSRVLMTQCGSWGDPGTVGNNWLFRLGVDSVQRILDAPGGLAAAMEHRHYWLGRSRPNIGKMAVMSQATGLDNTQLLPPYFPVLRGEDYLFAAMTMFLHPSSVVLDYGWCVPHLPLNERSGSGLNAPFDAGVSLALAARYISDHAGFEFGVSAATRLQQLAALLAGAGEMSSGELLALFRKELNGRRAEQLRHLQAQLQAAPAHGDPDWEAYLGRGINELTRALQVPVSIVDVPGMPRNATETQLLGQFRRAIAEFGRAVAAWPVIRGAAQRVVQRLVPGDRYNSGE